MTSQIPWHCTTDHTSYPGCGLCGPCRELAPQIFAMVREAERQRVHRWANLARAVDNIGPAITAARQRVGISRHAAAEQIELSDVALWKIEHGRQWMHRDTLRRVLAWLDTLEAKDD